MRRFYKYSGTIEEIRSDGTKRHSASEIKLYDPEDLDKAPTRLYVFGAMGDYLAAIEGTDVEQRYLIADWYYDSNLILWRIEIPAANTESGRPAKIIALDRADPDTLFQSTSSAWSATGDPEYIVTRKPEAMSPEVYCEFLAWNAAQG